jgi:branched-chain amino acid transport system ATP-binding protein
MSDVLLTLQGVHTHIGQYHILQGVDLEVPAGGVTMLLGRNGAGKTTTLRTIMGLWRASKGRITFDGTDITGLPTPDISRLGIAFVPEDMGIFAGLTVEENMRLAAQSGAIDSARLDWIFSAFPPLKTFWKFPAGNLSGGQKQMLSVARAVAEKRRLYLIDEPSKGLAPAIVSSLAKALKDLKAEGATVLLVEQNFSMARALGDTVAVMDDGHVVHGGLMAELASDRTLQTRFMGLTMEVAD